MSEPVFCVSWYTCRTGHNYGVYHLELDGEMLCSRAKRMKTLIPASNQNPDPASWCPQCRRKYERLMREAES